MAKLAIDKDEHEWIYERDDSRNDGTFFNWIELPSGSIEKLIGRKLTLKDDPVELVE
jgi:hypothetical protein